jgi:hypothetical protein
VLLLLLQALATVGELAAQPQLHLHGATPLLAATVAHCEQALCTAAPVAGDDALHVVLGQLRRGDVAAAERCVPVAAPWSVLGRHFVARAANRYPTDADLTSLRTAMLAVEQASRSRSFVHETLVVHALRCLGDLVEHSADAATAMALRERALARLAVLEREAWQPGSGHFRLQLCKGAILVPEEADPATLLPACLGHDLASGDRWSRHLATVLRCTRRRQDPPCDRTTRTALQVVTAAILADDDVRSLLWTTLLATANEIDAPATAGRQLDALVFAFTGLPQTARPEPTTWTRFAPWLPADLRWLRLGPLLANGARYELELHVAEGDRTTAERGDPTAFLGADGPRLLFTLTRTDVGQDERHVRIDGSNGAVLHMLRGGERLTGSLPRVQPQAKHHLHRLGGLPIDEPTRGR